MFGRRRKRSIERRAMERILLRGKGTLILFLIKYVELMLTQDNSTEAATSELIICQEKRLKHFSFSE